jgi:DNA-binding CsgD family transcriptional regulator/N-acetylneuraminic acid mutarotase
LADELTPLSDREMEILQLVATGATNQQIAQALVISVNTVKVHLRNIYAKLGVASRTEATMVAVREGWVEVARQEDGVDQDPGSSGASAGPVSLATAGAAAAPVEVLPPLEPAPRVSRPKRIALSIGMLVALMALVLPAVLEDQASRGTADPISGVFPTAPPGSTTTRWRTRAQLPTPRTGLAVVSVEGMLYAIGGVSNDGVTGKVEVYDPETDSWATGSTKPTPAGFVSAVEVGGLIYVPGGIDARQQALDVLEVYDPIEDIWQTRAPLPQPVGAYGLAALEDHVYLFGGRNGQGYLDAVYRYDPATDVWEARRPMVSGRGFLGAATAGDRIYVAGGYDDVAEYHAVDAYDPLTDTWSPLPPMTLPRGGLVLVAVREQLYAIGGGMAGYLAFNERFDPRTGAWSNVETPVREQWQGLGAAFVTPEIYAIGGWNDGNLSVNEAYQALFQSLVPLLPANTEP